MTKRIELTPRLQAVADFVPAGAKFADIGTDHAFLPTYLLQMGKIKFAIAADIRPGPLSRAKSTGESYHMGEALQFRLCDGLVGIEAEEVEAIAIAGMGGETMIHILNQSPWALDKHLILQPMSTQPELRQFLWEHGVAISREKTVREGDTLYTVMSVIRGQQDKPSLAELWAGRQWQGLDDPLRGDLLDKLQEKLNYALDSLTQGDSDRVAQRRQELSQLKAELIEMREEWKTWQR